MFYNRIIADKKPYFFRYKYKQLAKEFNEYKKKNEENAQIHFSMTLEELMEKKRTNPEDMTVAEQNFLMYYDKFLPVIDSDCVMNKICKHIEGIDFHIKQKVRSNHDFDYKSLQTSNFNLNNKLYLKIKSEVENTFKDWEQKSKSRRLSKVEKTLNQSGSQAKFEREAEISSLKMRLEEICGNEESLANHLVYLFYVEKPSFSKSTLWSLVGRQIFENVKTEKTNKATNMYYINFPVKDINGDLEFLYEKYQIKHIGFESSNNSDSALDMIPVEEEVID